MIQFDGPHIFSDGLVGWNSTNHQPTNSCIEDGLTETRAVVGGWLDDFPEVRGVKIDTMNLVKLARDLTRPHPKWWFSKGIPLISGKSRLVKYFNLARWMILRIFLPIESMGLPSLKLTVCPPENRPGPKRKRSYSNHPFSGDMLVSGRIVTFLLGVSC